MILIKCIPLLHYQMTTNSAVNRNLVCVIIIVIVLIYFSEKKLTINVNVKFTKKPKLQWQT